MPRRPSYSPSRSPERRGRPSDDRMPEEKSSLLVKNIPKDTRPDELKAAFIEYGPVKDVYLPRDYHTGIPRGFGFVQFFHREDAAAAERALDRSNFGGREIFVVLAEERRKKPDEMRNRERVTQRRSRDWRSPPRRRSSRDRSPAPRHRSAQTYDRERSRSPRGRYPSEVGRYESRRSAPYRRNDDDEDDRPFRRSRSPRGDFSPEKEKVESGRPVRPDDDLPARPRDRYPPKEEEFEPRRAAERSRTYEDDEDGYPAKDVNEEKRPLLRSPEP